MYKRQALMGWMCERCDDVTIGNEWICSDPYVQRDHAEDPFDAFTRPVSYTHLDVYKRQIYFMPACFAILAHSRGLKSLASNSSKYF